MRRKLWDQRRSEKGVMLGVRGDRIMCQSIRIDSRYLRDWASEMEYLATRYPVATSSFPTPHNNDSILSSAMSHPHKMGNPSGPGIAESKVARGLSYLPTNAVQDSSHFSPGYRASRRHSSLPRSTYHDESRSWSSRAWRSSVRDQVGDLGDKSAFGEGGSVGEGNVATGRGRVSIINTPTQIRVRGRRKKRCALVVRERGFGGIVYFWEKLVRVIF